MALKSSDIPMVKRVALWLWPVDTEPKDRRMVKVARIFSTVGGMWQGITRGLGATTPSSHRTAFLTAPCPEGRHHPGPKTQWVPCHLLNSTLNHTFQSQAGPALQAGM